MKKYMFLKHLNISYDDFVDPPPGVKQTKYQSKKKKEKSKSKPKRSLRKDKIEEQP
ncbi:hypothetical protein Hanom_Chr05g00420901 [Helianthus anomalus]